MVRQTSKNPNVSAFTLVELIVALGVFTIVFASAFYCLQASSRLIETGRHHTRATQLLQSEIETIRSMAWADLNALPTAKTEINLDTQQFTQAVYEKYTLYRTIEGTGDVRKITYDLSWSNDVKTYDRRFIAVYTQGGLYDYIQ